MKAIRVETSSKIGGIRVFTVETECGKYYTFLEGEPTAMISSIYRRSYYVSEDAARRINRTVKGKHVVAFLQEQVTNYDKGIIPEVKDAAH